MKWLARDDPGWLVFGSLVIAALMGVCAAALFGKALT
jgi:hypothetical protein